MLRTSFIKYIAVSASVLSSLGLLLSMPQPTRAQEIEVEEDIPATVEERSPVMSGDGVMSDETIEVEEEIPATVEERSPVMSGDGVMSDETIEVEEEIPATVEERSPVMTGGSSQPATTQPTPNATTQPTPNATTTNSPRALW